MNFSLRRYRTAILVGLATLCILLGYMSYNLLGQLRTLASSESDNMQWSISQLDLEFANLSVQLSKKLSSDDPNLESLKLPIDIALSRLRIVNSGRAAEILDQDPGNRELLNTVNAFAAQVIGIIDRPSDFGRDEVRKIRDLTEMMRPIVRRLSNAGVLTSAENSKRRRAEFSSQLSRTGGMAIALLLLMGLLLLLLDRLLRRAARRDAELLASSRWLSSTIAASLDAIIIIDTKGNISGFNQAAEKIFGWKVEDVMGLGMAKTIVPKQQRHTFHHDMMQYLNAPTSSIIEQGRLEMSALRKSGEEFPVEMNVKAIKEAEGLRFVAYIRDISERKISETKLIDAKNQAQRMDAAKSQFLAFMSHEMRTPLSGLLGVLDLLKSTKLAKNQKRFVDIATASSEVLLEQVNEALDITRIETGKMILSPQPFDIADLLDGLVDVLDPLAKEKGLNISQQIDNAVNGRYEADSSRIRQILVNLVGNAIKFSDEGAIKITVGGINGPHDTALEISVTDHGRGIEAQFHEQIFDDFVALADGDERQKRGDGLGLSISRRIARMMGGDLNVDSDLGRGAKFTLTLPMKRVDPEFEHDVQVPARTRGIKAVRPLDILIVEDNNINRSILCEMLVQIGHRVHEARDGRECLSTCRGTSFDLIFMDISMPELDGITATELLRSGHSLNCDTRIIGLTAHGHEEYREKALAAGMTDFFTKPIRMAALEKIVTSPLNVEVEPNAASATAMEEIIEILGPEKFAQSCASFFGEFEAFLQSANQKRMTRTQMAQEAHRLKGGAAVLAFENLEPILLEAIVVVNEAPDQKLRAFLNHLANSKLESQKIVQKVLEKHKKMMSLENVK